VDVRDARLFTGYILEIDLSVYGLNGLAVDLPGSFIQKTDVTTEECVSCFDFNSAAGMVRVRLGAEGGQFFVKVKHFTTD